MSISQINGPSLSAKFSRFLRAEIIPTLFLNSKNCPYMFNKCFFLYIYSLKFVKVCFMAQNVFHLGKCSMGVREKMYILLLLYGVSYKYQQIYLINGAIQFNYIFTDSLPTGSTIVNKRVLKCLSRLVGSSILSCSFISCTIAYFDNLLLGT